VIDEAAAIEFEQRVIEAVAQGARLLTGNLRRGALYSPTVLDRVRPEMRLVREETSPGLARHPFLRCRRGDTHRQRHGLWSVSAVCTQRLDHITRFVSELAVGTVNVRECRVTGWN